MDFELTEEQNMIREMVSDFAKSNIEPVSSNLDHSATFPVELMLNLGELGLLGMSIPEQYDGVSLDMISSLLAIEETAKASPSIALLLLVQNMLCGHYLSTFGSESQKIAFLPELATGVQLMGWSCHELAGDTSPELPLAATREGGQWILTGSADFVIMGSNSQLLLVLASFEGTHPSDVRCAVLGCL